MQRLQNGLNWTVGVKKPKIAHNFLLFYATDLKLYFFEKNEF